MLFFFLAPSDHVTIFNAPSSTLPSSSKSPPPSFIDYREKKLDHFSSLQRWLISKSSIQIISHKSRSMLSHKAQSSQSDCCCSGKLFEFSSG